MAALRENSLRNLEPVQATELSLLLDLEAGWQNLLGTSSPILEGRAALQDLHGKQKAYAAFHDKMVTYNACYRPRHVPQANLISLPRLSLWCRSVRDLCLDTGRSPQSHGPLHLLEKAYRSADRIVSRMGQGVFSRSTLTDTMGAVIQELDALIRWCDNLSTIAVAG